MIASVILKIARRYEIVLEQAIAINYAVAFGLTLTLLKPTFPSDFSTLPWHILIALSVLLPSVFIIMGRAVEYVGIAKSDIAQRLSLIIPIILAFTLFGDTLTTNKIIGIILAFVALICLLVKDSEPNGKNTTLTGVLSLSPYCSMGINYWHNSCVDSDYANTKSRDFL